MRKAEKRGHSEEVRVAPVALLPSPFPAPYYHAARDAQPVPLPSPLPSLRHHHLTRTTCQDLNLLYFRAAYDFDFIAESLASVAKTDEFTRRLLAIYEAVHKEGIAQPLVLQIQRSDYMAHEGPDGQYALKQVPFPSALLPLPDGAKGRGRSR